MKPDPQVSLYQPLDTMLLRIPLLSVDRLMTFFEEHRLDWKPEERAITDITTVNGLPAGVYEQLSKWASDPIIKEAIFVASPSLYYSLPILQTRPINSSKYRRVASRFFRFVVRMSTRPTPFGIHAGVGLGQLGGVTDIQVGPEIENRTRTRPDMEWLLQVMEKAEALPGALESIKIKPNPLMFTAAGRLRVSHKDSFGKVKDEHFASLRVTPIVKRVLELSEEGVPFGALLLTLMAERPNAGEEVIRGFLASLYETGVLVSDLRPPLTGNTLMSFVKEKLEHVHGCEEVLDSLRELSRCSAYYDTLPVGGGLLSLKQLYDLADIHGASSYSSVQVDMKTSLQSSVLSSSLVSDISTAVDILIRVAPAAQQTQEIAKYCSRFIEKYSEGSEVPLLKLLDEEEGLGPLPSYQRPPSRKPATPESSTVLSQRDLRLIDLAMNANRHRLVEVELDESLLKEIEVSPQWRFQLPESAELFVTIAAESQGSIDSGEYLAVISPFGGDNPAGRAIARFCDILGEEATNFLRGIANREKDRHPQVIFAELVYLPNHGHFANVAIRPAVRKYEIVVTAAPGVHEDNVIPLSDLVVGAHKGKLYVRSVTLGAEIIVRSTHLLNNFGAPNVIRFLAELGQVDSRSIAPFDWGPAASQLSFLPRVRSGRVVLRPAEWRIRRGQLGRTDGDFNLQQWYTIVSNWRTECQVPRFVYLADHDNRLLLDLENPLSLVDFWEVCNNPPRGEDSIMIQEMLPDFKSVWPNGQGYRRIVEFVIAYERTKLLERSTIPTPPQSSIVSHSERSRSIGSNWLYFKIYSGNSSQNDLIANLLDRICSILASTQMVQRWFFVRYEDPDPHIRVRFEGESKILLSQVLPCLIRETKAFVDSGLIHRIGIDTYEREIERYGGIVGMHFAERIFHADSLSVARILNKWTPDLRGFPSLELGMLSIDRMLSSLGIMKGVRSEVYNSLHMGQFKRAALQEAEMKSSFHREWKRFQLLLGDHVWGNDLLGRFGLVEIFDERHLQLMAIRSEMDEKKFNPVILESFIESCVHMHCNRLFGINREQESAIYYHLWRSYSAFMRFVPPGLSII